MNVWVVGAGDIGRGGAPNGSWQVYKVGILFSPVFSCFNGQMKVKFEFLDLLSAAKNSSITDIESVARKVDALQIFLEKNKKVMNAQFSEHVVPLAEFQIFLQHFFAHVNSFYIPQNVYRIDSKLKKKL